MSAVLLNFFVYICNAFFQKDLKKSELKPISSSRNVSGPTTSLNLTCNWTKTLRKNQHALKLETLQLRVECSQRLINVVVTVAHIWRRIPRLAVFAHARNTRLREICVQLTQVLNVSCVSPGPSLPCPGFQMNTRCAEEIKYWGSTNCHCDKSGAAVSTLSVSCLTFYSSSDHKMATEPNEPSWWVYLVPYVFITRVFTFLNNSTVTSMASPWHILDHHTMKKWSEKLKASIILPTSSTGIDAVLRSTVQLLYCWISTCVFNP